MTTLEPRPPYSREELQKLYPASLQLRHVQVVMRHGERTPVGPRFQNAGLSPYWPYCNAARQLRSVVMTTKDWSKFDGMQYTRRMETFGRDDLPVIATGPKGEIDGVCNPGELTDRGRETTMALGERLRNLYVDQLHFLPKVLSTPSILYIRSTPIPRALESVQQAFLGLYPPAARTATLEPPTIVARSPADETLFPNESNCRRFAELSHAFADRAASVWNESPEMDYLNKKLGKWMPEGAKKVAVDGHPRLSGIMDTLNSTLAHGPDTRLPSEFYETKVRENIDKIVVEEWFAGYQESREYRLLGIGGLVRDMTTRMMGHVESSGEADSRQPSEAKPSPEPVKFCISGAHDTTLAAIVASLGAYEKTPWPPYTSHVAMELFRTHDKPAPVTANSGSSWWSSFPYFSLGGTKPVPLSEKRTPALTPADKSRISGYYVRVRYNDRPITVPGCKPVGKHLEGDESFCTLEAFKEIVDKFAPTHWKAQCRENLGSPAFPERPEPAGV